MLPTSHFFVSESHVLDSWRVGCYHGWGFPLLMQEGRGRKEWGSACALGGQNIKPLFSRLLLYSCNLAALGRYVAVFVLGLCIPLLDVTGPLLPQWNFLTPATWLWDKQHALRALSTNHRYSVQVLSTDPLMVYLDGFIHPREVKYLTELGYELTQPP